MGSMEITTIVTCMTDGERPFLADSLRSVRDQTVPSKIILCVAENNTWVRAILNLYMSNEQQKKISYQ